MGAQWCRLHLTARGINGLELGVGVRVRNRFGLGSRSKSLLKGRHTYQEKHNDHGHTPHSGTTPHPPSITSLATHAFDRCQHLVPMPMHSHPMHQCTHTPTYTPTQLHTHPHTYIRSHEQSPCAPELPDSDTLLDKIGLKEGIQRRVDSVGLNYGNIQWQRNPINLYPKGRSGSKVLYVSA